MATKILKMKHFRKGGLKRVESASFEHGNMVIKVVAGFTNLQHFWFVIYVSIYIKSEIGVEDI